MSDSGICGAKTKQGTPCKGKPMTNGRCRLHGGLTPRGLAHPNTKTGRWSKDLPTRLAARYQESLQDPELLNLKEDIALIDSRLAEILENLQDGDTRKLWQDLKEAFGRFEKATINEDKAEQRLSFLDIKRLIQQGNSVYLSWMEAYGVIDQRRRTVESERKRLVEMQQTISYERAMLLIGALVGVIRRHIDDPTTLSAISQDIRAITVIDHSR